MGPAQLRRTSPHRNVRGKWILASTAPPAAGLPRPSASTPQRCRSGKDRPGGAAQGAGEPAPSPRRRRRAEGTALRRKRLRGRRGRRDDSSRERPRMALVGDGGAAEPGPSPERNLEMPATWPDFRVAASVVMALTVTSPLPRLRLLAHRDGHGACTRHGASRRAYKFESRLPVSHHHDHWPSGRGGGMRDSARLVRRRPAAGPRDRDWHAARTGTVPRCRQ
jgi:hypothetical protein